MYLYATVVALSKRLTLLSLSLTQIRMQKNCDHNNTNLRAKRKREALFEQRFYFFPMKPFSKEKIFATKVGVKMRKKQNDE